MGQIGALLGSWRKLGKQEFAGNVHIFSRQEMAVGRMIINKSVPNEGLFNKAWDKFLYRALATGR
jgi:hypothetical protein